MATTLHLIDGSTVTNLDGTPEDVANRLQVKSSGYVDLTTVDGNGKIYVNPKAVAAIVEHQVGTAHYVSDAIRLDSLDPNEGEPVGDDTASDRRLNHDELRRHPAKTLPTASR